ncbi:MAG: cob(I)yrinic acid a,c-diamide adenosyltransferase [Eubacteriales bacterium]|nr:cob(I)yrinic acid a,c-diamide adenosyltransferase [Eubacteriales bacterium]
MEKGLTEVYCGTAKGKTTLAMGQSLRAATEGQSVIIIQFMKGKERQAMDFLQNLEDLDIKIFRFEKRDICYDELDDQEKAEEKQNILNGLNFARKVVATQECDVLVLDEILGLLDSGIAEVDTMADILKLKREPMHIIMTGRELPETLRSYVDCVTTLTMETPMETPECENSNKSFTEE